MITRRNTLLAVAAVALTASVSAAGAGSIKIGNTNPYSGPASSYGTIGHTIEAYIGKINAEGGIDGTTIEFISYDDSYSPPKTVEQIRRLVEQDEVDMLFQTLGTPTNSAIHKYVNVKKVPHLFVATGAAKWGNPAEFPWTMGWQPNYPTEAKIYAAYIREHHPNAKIAILYQNDDYGKDYLNGFKDGLGDLAANIVAESPYEVSDPTIDSQIISFKASGADVFFNISIPKFAAQAIRKANEIGWEPVHFLNNVSASIGGVIKPAGFEASQGIITVAYMMDPTDPQWHETDDYKDWSAFMDEYYPAGDKTSSFTAYGYAVAKTLEHVLRACNGDFSRENIMKQAASLREVRIPMLLPGITLSTSEADFYPIESMQLQRVEGESFKLFGGIISAESS